MFNKRILETVYYKRDYYYELQINILGFWVTVKKPTSPTQEGNYMFLAKHNIYPIVTKYIR